MKDNIISTIDKIIDSNIPKQKKIALFKYMQIKTMDINIHDAIIIDSILQNEINKLNS